MAALVCGYVAFFAAAAHAGGPKYVAGVSYFNPSALGQPIIWAGGQVNYYVDQGPLGPVSNAQAVAMVDSAAAIWSAVPTAAVTLTDQGSLAEDVNGSNVLAGNGYFTAPADITPSATSTPVAVIFDSDGSVINALYGSGASEPDNCALNSLFVWIDNFSSNGTLAHAVIVLNGLCATSPSLLTMMSYQLERAFGRVLDLDFSQVNPNAQAQAGSEPGGVLGWPVMQPLTGECGPQGGSCIPNQTTLRYDDIAALNRLYPVTAANLAGFPGKILTAANTISIQGTLAFRNGQGMQGVNVVARPLDANGNPLYQYTVTFVSGAYFAGNRGNSATGFTDSNGNRLDRFGGSNPALEGFFDLSGIPLPPGVASATYQITFEPVNPLYIDNYSVGPYIVGSPLPSGTMPARSVAPLSAGSSATLTVIIANSASDIGTRPIGTEASPMPLPIYGMWTSRLGRAGAADWLLLPVRANRTFTIVAQALDETGTPSAFKALPALGVWDGYDQIGTSPAGYVPAQNGAATGETWLQVSTSSQDIVRLAVADQRGDGRPDYLYRGWILYADSVSPARLPASGGVIVIRGIGFRLGDTVTVGGVPAQVAEILPSEITAIVPANSANKSGSLDITVSDQPLFFASATIPGGLSYDSATGDLLGLLTAPAGQLPLNVPQPFSVIAKGVNGLPAAGVTVTYTLTGGTAALACGQNTCAVTASGDGRATVAITPTSSSVAVVTASLTDGASLQAHFTGVAPPSIASLTSTLYLAGGAAARTVSWPVQALVQSAGAPISGRPVSWQGGAGIVAPGGTVLSNSAGIAGATLTVGPLSEGQTATAYACLNGSTPCVTFQAFGSRPELATLGSVSGTAQSMVAGSVPAPVTLRVFDQNGNPMAGGMVTVYQALYSYAAPCPRHGRCIAAELLASQSATLISALDGTVTLTPLAIAGIPTSLIGVASTGNSASLTFTIETHP